MIITPGDLYIISAPSGAGKTSLVKALLQTGIDLSLSISYTSRSARPEEIDGRDYHFIRREIFEQRLKQDEFLESAQVYGNFYGTSKHWINETVASGRDVLLEIDSQGAHQVQKVFPQAVKIFILPPSLEVLEMRLRQRAQDSLEAIGRRLAAARDEISHAGEYDYVIINDRLDKALQDLKCIVQAERLRMTKQLARHHGLVAQLGRTPSP
ncbi:guanylate kinase [Nitrosospira sp. NRS527]|uniref:guanylate kinase n=1 Tax=Nitrosospira sp. NRS527 TaxID=155925 RepID=UPI001AF03186|nr:guanylate kinase [Nitrosospira sp. NRS527]BCT66520.1 Guanylate kinase [Nitrosospira sp. NRS527]